MLESPAMIISMLGWHERIEETEACIGSQRPEGADASAREKGRALRDFSAKMGADQSMLSKDEIHLVTLHSIFFVASNEIIIDI